MSRRINLINNVLYLGLTMLALFGIVLVCNGRYNEQWVDILIKFGVSAILVSFLATVFHEVGHLIGGKKAGFEFSSMVIWFLKWTKGKKRIKFSFTSFGAEAGYTEMIPTTTDNMDKRLKKMTSSALIASFTLILLGVVPLIVSGLPVELYCFLSMFLPVGVYSFFGNALPMVNEGFLNDGAIISGIKKQDDTVKVALSLLKIQAEMYDGKTPSEIDEKLYFDLPQLPEDDPNFVMLLNARYTYYLDAGNYEMAKMVSERLESLIDLMPRQFVMQVKTDLLYNACTFDFNEDKADDIMYEVEKYLNKYNTATNVRTKLAYILNVKKETEPLDIFYKKGMKEAKRCKIKGYGAFEQKLLDQLVAGFKKTSI